MGACVVKGVEQFRQRLRAIPGNVRDEVVLTLQRVAENIVGDMRVLNPLSDADIEINWTWGDAPAGSISLGRVAKTYYEKIGITIYARGRSINAAWFEFGTAERFHKSGKGTGRIVAQPFFFPAYRANRTRARRAISAAVRRGFKKS